MKDLTIVDEHAGGHQGTAGTGTNTQAIVIDPIDRAVEAYRNRTPESIRVFRALTDGDAEVVIRILKMTARAKKAKDDGKS